MKRRRFLKLIGCAVVAPFATMQQVPNLVPLKLNAAQQAIMVKSRQMGMTSGARSVIQWRQWASLKVSTTPLCEGMAFNDKKWRMKNIYNIST